MHTQAADPAQGGQVAVPPALWAVHEHRVNCDNAAHRDLFCEITLDFAHGRCAWFALAEAGKFDLPLVALFDSCGQMVHVMCRVGDLYFDAYGLGTHEQALQSQMHFMGERMRDDDSLRLYETNEAVVREAFSLTEPAHYAEIEETVQVVERLVDALGLPMPHARKAKRFESISSQAS